MLVAELRAEIFDGSRCSFTPVAVVMVGTPGSGKTTLVQQGLEYLQSRHGGPPPAHYAHINPDTWITEMCDNNNAHRNAANYANHETFLLAIRQRRHVVFDAIGKSVLNTCGRVIARLQQAGYRVHICTVLATFETCCQRILHRREASGRVVSGRVVEGRSVPEAMVRQVRLCAYPQRMRFAVCWCRPSRPESMRLALPAGRIHAPLDPIQPPTLDPYSTPSRLQAVRDVRRSLRTYLTEPRHAERVLVFDNDATSNEHETAARAGAGAGHKPERGVVVGSWAKILDDLGPESSAAGRAEALERAEAILATDP